MASYKDKSAPIVRFLFAEACPFDVEKTVGDDGVIKDEDDIGKNDEPDDVVLPEEEEATKNEEKNKDENQGNQNSQGDNNVFSNVFEVWLHNMHHARRLIALH